jgi:hypothetical protein
MLGVIGVGIVTVGVVDVGAGVVEMKAPWVPLGGDFP